MLQALGRLAAVFGSGRPSGDDGRLWGRPALGLQARSGVPVTSASVLQLDVVQAVLENIGGAISTLPVVVFRRAEDGTRTIDRAHPLHTLLNDRPNRWQTAQEFKDDAIRHLAFHRNAYARIVGEGAVPVAALEPIHPERVTRIERDGQGRTYYTVAGLGGAPAEILRDDLMWHLRRAPLTVDGLRGLSVVETGRETFGRAIGVREYGDDFFANGGASGGVLEHPGRFADKAAQDQFLETWREGGTGRNRHRDRLLLNGVKYSPLSVKNNEAQFLETIANSDIQVCRLWNMPPHRIGILDRATLSNIEQQSIDYVVYTLAPWICGFEQGAERDLAFDLDGAGGVSVEINVAGLLRGDLTARYKAYAQGRQWGWLSVNEIRKLENMNSIGGDGDTYLQPKNMGDAADGPDDDGGSPLTPRE